MFFELDINPRDRAASRFIGSVRKLFARVVFSEKENFGITQQMIAEKLGVNRSVINRVLKGEANLTLRSVAELAWALGMTAEITLNKAHGVDRQNLVGNTVSSGTGFAVPKSSWSPTRGSEVKNAPTSAQQYGTNDNYAPVEVAA